MKQSDWLMARFGDNAEAVAREIPRALARAHAYASDAQAHSGTDKQDPYGHTLKKGSSRNTPETCRRSAG